MNKYSQNISKSLKNDLNAKNGAGLSAISRRVPTEAQEQRILCQWLDARGILYAANQDGAYRAGGARAGFWAKKTGAKKGRPDIEIFDRPPRYPDYVGVAIELKRVGGKMSNEQREWIRELGARGWAAFEAQGANQAINVLMGLGF